MPEREQRFMLGAFLGVILAVPSGLEFRQLGLGVWHHLGLIALASFATCFWIESLWACIGAEYHPRLERRLGCILMASILAPQALCLALCLHGWSRAWVLQASSFVAFGLVQRARVMEERRQRAELENRWDGT